MTRADMRIAILQTNPTVGDVPGNTARIAKAWREARAAGADLCVAPELATCGYPPRDLLDRTELLDACDRALEELASLTVDGPALVLGSPRRVHQPHPEARDPAPDAGPDGAPLANAILLLDQGGLAAERHKSLLPDYDVFTESRHFRPAQRNPPVLWRGLRLGLTVCEDLWNDPTFWKQRRYPFDPIASLAEQGVDLLINVSASPWSERKPALRERMLTHAARTHAVPIVWVNQTGANDDLIFDGHSTVVDASGQLRARALPFRETVLLHTLGDRDPTPPPVSPDPLEELHQALVLGIRDYVLKSGFRGALLGLSGGIDSAVTAALAVDALGPENVRGVALPSAISSTDSVEDALDLAQRLGIACDVMPIAHAVDALQQTLSPALGGPAGDLTSQNLQSRVRGTLLMALSNQSGQLLLTTGNKSELAVGYCTLYGDMNGALAVIADVLKTRVYALARWINARPGGPVIPERTLTKAPSAELKPDQRDQDTLPPYEVLDPIVARWIEDREPAASLVADGFDPEVVGQVVALLHRNEYKRHQAPPVLKTSRRALGSGWRMPLAARHAWSESDP